MTDTGFIKINRKITDWKFYENPDMLALWIHILINASWQERTYKGELVQRGEFWTTYEKLGAELGFDLYKTRRMIIALQNEKQIEIKSTNKKTLISVVNYDVYQDSKIQNAKQNENKTKTKRNTSAKQPATQVQNAYKKKKLKKEEIKNIYINTYGEFQNIQLKDEEFQKLCEKFSEDKTRKAIEYLSSYKVEKGYKTKSDYLTIRRWVIDAIEEKAKPGAKVEVPDFMREPIKESKPASEEQLKKIKEMQEEMK